MAEDGRTTKRPLMKMITGLFNWKNTAVEENSRVQQIQVRARRSSSFWDEDNEDAGKTFTLLENCRKNHGTGTPEEDITEIADAAAKGNVERMEELIQGQEKLITVVSTRMRQSLFHIAAKNAQNRQIGKHKKSTEAKNLHNDQNDKNDDSVTDGGLNQSDKTYTETNNYVQVFKKLGNKALKKKPDLFKNKLGNTWLHQAAKYGSVEVANHLVSEFRGDCLNNIENDRGQTFIELALFSTHMERKEIVEFLKDIKDDFLEKFAERRSESKKPLLHVIVANGFHELVQKFSFVRLNEKDEREDTVFHLAARRGNIKMLKELVASVREKSKHSKLGNEAPNAIKPEKLKSILALGNEEGETVLHLAIKHANQEFIEALIRLGADLEAIDLSGNTPLHDLVEKAAEDKSNIDKYIGAWKSVVDNAVIWWSKKYKNTKKNDPEYRNLQRDALHFLRSEIPDAQNMSVLQQAGYKGLDKLVTEMILVKDVFVREEENKEKGGQREGRNEQKHNKEGGSSGEKAAEAQKRVKIDVTNLMPHLTKKKNKGHPGSQCESFLTALLKVRHSNRADEIFEVEPMKTLVRDYWFVYQWWMVLMLLCHLLHMSFFTTYSLNTITSVYSNTTSSSQLVSNQLFLIWPIILALTEIVAWISPLVSTLNNISKQKKDDITRYMKRLKEDINLDVKDVINLPTFLISLVVMMIPVVAPIGFSLTTVVSMQLVEGNIQLHVMMTEACLILGWLLTFTWAGAFKPVYRFLSALKIIVLKDIMSFVFFYIFFLLAFSSYLFALMRKVPSLALEYDDLDDVMFELILIGVGAESRMSSADISQEFEQAGYDPFIFKIVYTLYVIITLVALLNLIVASMVDTYSSLARTDRSGWRLNSLKVASRNSNARGLAMLLRKAFKKTKLIEAKVSEDNDGFFYLSMSRYTFLKERPNWFVSTTYLE